MRIRTKTALLFSGGALTVTVLVTVILGITLERAFQGGTLGARQLVDETGRVALNQRALVLVSSLARVAAEPVYELDVARLDELVAETLGVEGVTRVELLDGEGRVLADGDQGTYLRDVVRSDPGHRRAARASEAGVRWQADSVVAWAPVRIGREQLGGVWAQLSLEPHERALERLHAVHGEQLAGAAEEGQAAVLAAGAGALVAGLLLSLLFASTMTRRVRVLAAATKRVAAGDLEARVPETGGDELAELARQFNRMLAEITGARAQLEETHRLEKELEIARSIQTAVLPALPLEAEGLRVAGRMLTATAVGGDYYDVRQTTAGLWIGIGDVSGHGVNAGLVMMMAQNAIGAVTTRDPAANPSQVLAVVNRVLHDNLRERMRVQDHMTITLLRHLGGGRLLFAGAHEEMVVFRASSGRLELLPTPGTWLGVMPDIGSHLVNCELRLERGDLLVLYTDGVVEARDAARAQLGTEGLLAAVRGGGSAPEVVERVMAAAEAHGVTREDDRTVLVVERIA